MTRNTLKARGGRQAGHDSASHKSAGPGRLRSRLRSLCVVICCALALQPSPLTPGGGAARAAARPRPSVPGSLTDRAARSLFALAAAVGGGVRQLLPVRKSGHRDSAGREAAFGPEPAAAFLIQAPSALTVTETHDSRIVLSWPQVAGATGYRVERSPNLLTPYDVVGQPLSTGFEDTSQLTRGHAYLYRVRAVDAAGERSAPSPVAMATAIDFEDPDLVAGVTRVKAAHVNDLRLAVAGVRGAALLTTSWQETVPSGGTLPVRAEHVRELRRELDEGLAMLGLPVGAYEDTPLNGSPNGSPIRKRHFEQLRERTTRGTGVKGSGLTAYDFATKRLDPSNRTGAGGVDLISRNFNWSLPVVSLPGRSGLDLGLALTYNSLVWTKSGDYMLFDGDWGWPAPGFRLGFPVVQGKFLDAQAGKTAYMLVTPAGGRVSLRQKSASEPTVYEAGDSSYLRLAEKQDGSLELLAPGGTRMTFRVHGGAYKCEEIKDRNGNFITVAYDEFGKLDAVTDTLGRLVDFDYYADGYLKEIRQTWHREVGTESGVQTVTETHRWAKFEYFDPAVRTNFTGMEVFGPTGGQTFHALRKVTLADDSSFTFDYTTWGQVHQVESRAEDNGLLNRVALDLPADETQTQDDCPRFVNRYDWAAYWNGDTNGVPDAGEEAATWYDVYDFAGGVGKAKAPDGTLHTETYETAGWKKGLVTRADEYGADDYNNPKKWTVLDWAQDDVNLPYTQNPRVEETHVYDPEGNHRRTKVTYTSFGLPSDVEEYDRYATTVVRRTHTEYVPGSVSANGAYVGRRIIGLPQERTLYGTENGQEQLYSKVSYDYDLGGEFLAAPEGNPASVTQHDGANFGVSFTLRGNLCRTRRWDVSDAENLSKTVAPETGYNTLGSAVFTRDALGHRVSVSYADSDGGGRYAYPTTVTDPDGFTSSAWYNYDIGVVTKSETPLPNVTNDQTGPVVTRYYDAAGRALKVSGGSGAYTRWEYGESGLFVKQHTTVNVDTGLVETLSMSVADGAGHVRGTLQKLPGSAGGYSAQRFTYDNVGQRVRVYNPIEVSVNASNLPDIGAWQPAGDDATSSGGTGWVYASTVYDWKGRPLVITEPKRDPNDQNEQPAVREFEYGGCGCAGKEVVTERGALVPGPQGAARRARRTYSDVLGRAVRTEVLDWDGSVYSTTTAMYDALDRVVRARQYAGEAPEQEPVGEGSSYQTTTMEYDGHGRLRSRRLPKYAPNTAATYEYDADDTLKSVTDPRDVVTTYGFTNAAGYTNKRHLVNSVTYSNAPTGVPVPAPARFEYDAAGNRTSMTDGTGSVAYQYDTLSRLDWETRQFSALPGHTYTTDYEYNVSGQLKYLIDPAGSRVDYKYDAAGRVLGVTGSGPASAPSYASGMVYRAWGALKDVDYGNGSHQFFGYDGKLQPSTMELRNVIVKVTNQTPLTMKWDYDYYADGRVNHAYDRNDNRLDRKFEYDGQGRLKEAYTGLEARGQAPTQPANSPFRQTFGYDEWGNMKGRSGRLWKQPLTAEAGEYGSDDRRDGWLYDAAGNLTQGDSHTSDYDAAGAQTYSHPPAAGECGGYDYEIAQSYDGEGRTAHRVQTTRRDVSTDPAQPQCVTDAEETYYVYSAGLGGAKLIELDTNGEKVKGYVYGGGGLLAKQEIYPSINSSGVKWQHQNPGSSSWVETTSDRAFERQEMDPLGAEVGAHDPFLIVPNPNYSDVHGDAPMFLDGGDPFHLSDGCGDIDGMPASCAEIADRLDNGSVVFEVRQQGRGPQYIHPTSVGLGNIPTGIWVTRASGSAVYDEDTGQSVPGGEHTNGLDSSEWVATGLGYSFPDVAAVGNWIPRPLETESIFAQGRRSRRLSPEEEARIQQRYDECMRRVREDLERDQAKLDQEPQTSPGDRALSVLNWGGRLGGGLAALSSGENLLGNVLNVGRSVKRGIAGSVYYHGIFKGGPLLIGGTYNLGRAAVRSLGCPNSNPYFYNDPR